MNGRSRLPNDPKIIVRIYFGAFWVCNKMLSYGRLTINFSIVAFAQAMWLFSYSIAFLPDAYEHADEHAALFYLLASA